MLENFIQIEKNQILEQAKEYKKLGCRFAAMTCEHDGEKFELTYHFDLNYELKNLRAIVDGKEPIDSISTVYPSAFLIENEFQDLYGLVFQGLIIDYKGNLYLTPDGPTTPMMKSQK